MIRAALTFSILAALLATHTGCDQVCADGDCETRVFVAQNIRFATEESDTVADGFDLDGIVSDGSDLESCNRVDYTSPDGEPGIDNQFAVLWEAITDIIGDAVEGLIVGAINDGNLLFMIELAGIDDLDSDGCVDVHVFLGEGQPYVGTDGLITTGQTFDIRADTPFTTVACAQIRDGVLHAGPFDGTIPISILDQSLDLEVYDAVISGALADDGSFNATLGAGVDVEQVVEFAEGADYRLEGVVGPLMRNRADLHRDEYGDCQKLSATLYYDGIPAFVFEDAPR